MTALILEPHADDAVLFSCWNALRYRAHIVTVLESHVQEQRGYGITQADRLTETAAAMTSVLGLKWDQWPYRDDDPDWAAIRVALGLVKERLEPERVFAPAVEPGGHDHHNRLAALTDEVFGDTVAHYLTYTVEGKSTNGVEVMFEPAWVTLKLRALACYRSQIETSAAGCTPHFVRGLEEYLAS